MIDTLYKIEGALFASNAPLSAENLKKTVCPDLNLGEIRSLLNQLEAHYENRGIRLVQVASGYRFQIANEVAEQLGTLLDDKPNRFSKAFMEIVALIAYRQPITRGEIEAIRGVAVSTQTMKTLSELDWIRVVGHKEVPGKPALYATTKAFLDFFSLKTLEDLPPLMDLTELKDLQEEVILEVQHEIEIEEEQITDEQAV
jgi:segregation and condensation protein B